MIHQIQNFGKICASLFGMVKMFQLENAQIIQGLHLTGIFEHNLAVEVPSPIGLFFHRLLCLINQGKNTSYPLIPFGV